MKFLDETEADDPILSVVNLIDVFLVVIAALLLAVANSSVNPFSTESVTIIKNPGKDNMEIIVKDGQKVDHYKASGEIGEGQGNKAGVAYRLKDGSMVYVPEPGGAGAEGGAESAVENAVGTAGTGHTPKSAATP